MKLSRILTFLPILFAAAAPAAEVAHPFILWSKDEAAAIRQRIETDPLAKRQYERMVAYERQAKPIPRGRVNPDFLDLFDYAVLGDETAGARQKKELLKFIGARPPESVAGNPETGNAPWRDDRTLDALRYDVLHGLLTPAERQGVEETIRFYVKWFQSANGPWTKGDHGLPKGARMGWLPNMQWPTVAGVHVLAAVSGDPNLIRDSFEAVGGWKWYFDHYLSGDSFYMEEFGKYYSNIGAMLLWCEGLERLGLGQYGYGYTGANGATMRDFLSMKIRVGLPQTEQPEAAPLHGIVTMGDASSSPLVERHDAAVGGHPWWTQSRMNGSIRKMREPLWFEIGLRRFPEDGYAFFLAQMRPPGEALYLPTLYFGLEPIDPAKVAPPPAPSIVTRERGFALLRADESPAYWEGAAPAVALQFAMYYVHYVHDCFAILNFNALNRPIYERMGTVQKGYAGGDPWRDHVRGKASGVIVDGLRPKPVDSGENGTANERVRDHLASAAKFVAVHASGVYPDVEQERALVLTREYLFDLFWLQSEKPRAYEWHVLSAGALPASANAPWRPVAELPESYLTEIHARDLGGDTWSAEIAQQPDGGVRVSMLGEPGSISFAGRPPGLPEGAPGVKLMVRRESPATMFAALHEPFSKKPPALTLERIEQTAIALAVRVTGAGVDDRILISLADAATAPQTLADDGETFTFTGYGHIRVGPDAVTVTGNVISLAVRTAGSPRLLVNGVEQASEVADGFLKFSAKPTMP